MEACKLVTGKSREVSYIGGVIRWKALRSDFVSKAQPSVVLHRPRLGSIGLGIYSSGAVLIKKDGSYLPSPKFDGKEKTGRSTTDDYHVCMQLGHELMVDTNSKRGQPQSCNSNNILCSPIGLVRA